MQVSQKEKIRSLLLRERRALAPGFIRFFSRAIFENAKSIFSRLPIQEAVGLYSPMRGEVCPVDFFRYFRSRGILTPIAALQNNAIKYVLPNCPSFFDKSFSPRVAFIPGVAFSSQKYRLGMGRGHFDRYLSLQAKHTPVVTVGLCFESQVNDTFQNEFHDFPMDFVVTEKRILS